MIFILKKRADFGQRVFFCAAIWQVLANEVASADRMVGARRRLACCNPVTAALPVHSFNCFMILGPTSAISAAQAATTDKPIGNVLNCATPPISTGPNSKPK